MQVGPLTPQCSTHQRPVRYQLRRYVYVCIVCVVADSAYRHVPADGALSRELIAVEMGPYMRRPMWWLYGIGLFGRLGIIPERLCSGRSRR